jgi:hypothetical protein
MWAVIVERRVLAVDVRQGNAASAGGNGLHAPLGQFVEIGAAIPAQFGGGGHASRSRSRAQRYA